MGPLVQPDPIREPVKKVPPPPPVVQSDPVREPVKDVQATPPVMTILFGLPHDGEKQLKFVRRPIGIDFHTGLSPMTVKRLQKGSHAEELGVESDWTVRSINGVEVATLSSVRVREILVRESKKLPSA